MYRLSQRSESAPIRRRMLRLADYRGQGREAFFGYAS
jgi:hypothetical protein